MSLYTEIFKIQPYLKSIRTLEEKYFSIDIYFSKSWKIPSGYVDEKKIMEHNSNEVNKRFFSFVSEIKESDLNGTVKAIENIIDYNIEREEKENLFKLKIKDLKNVFEKEKLEDLKSLQFEMDRQVDSFKEEYTLDNEDSYEEQTVSDKLVSGGVKQG